MFSKSREVTVCISMLLLLLLPQFFGVMDVHGCASAISLSPASIIGPPPDVGDTFVLTLKVAGQTDLWSWKISLHWDPAVLNLQSVAEGPFMKSDGNSTVYSAGTVNQVNGTLSEVSSRRLASKGLAGSGDLATFTFKVVGYSVSASQIQIVGDELRTSDECNPPISHITTGATIIVTPPTSKKPVATISSPANNSVVYFGNSIYLDGSNSRGGLNTYGVRPVTSWVWTLAGSYIGTFNVTAKTITPTHIGDITIQLTVTAPDGTPPVTGYDPVDSTSVTVHVRDVRSTPRETRDTIPPVVSFIIIGLDRDNSTYANKTLTFDASKSYDPNGIISSYVWNFGDGSSGNGKIADHNYSKVGFYTAKLVCTDSAGNSAWKTANITVMKPKGKLGIDIYTLSEPSDGRGYNNTGGPFEPFSEVKLLAAVKIDGIPAQNMSVSFIVRGPASSLPFTMTRDEQTDQNGVANLTFTIPSSKTPEGAGVLGKWTARASVEYFGEEVGDTMPFKVDWAIDLGSEKTSLKVRDSQDKPVSFLLLHQSGTLEFQLLNQFESNVVENVVIQVFDHEGNELLKSVNNYNFDTGVNTLKVPFTVPINAVLGDASVKISVEPHNYDPDAFTPSRTFNDLRIMIQGVELNHGELLEKSVFVGHPLNMTIAIENKGETSSDATIKISCNQTRVGLIVTHVDSKSSSILTYSWNTTNCQPGTYVVSASIDEVPYSVQSGNSSIILGSAVLRYPSAMFLVQWFGFLVIVTAVTSTVALVAQSGRSPRIPK